MTRSIRASAKHSLKTEWVLGTAAAVIAMTALGLGRAFGKIEHTSLHQKLCGWAAALVLVVAGGYAIVHHSRAHGRFVSRQSNPGAGGTIRLVTYGRGSVMLVIALRAGRGVSLDHLLIGAGIAGIILGVAAQQSLGNVFAAVVMLFARPFVVGDTIRIRSGVTGVLDVKVLGTGLTYVTVMSDDGVLRVPNSIMLGAGIGQLRPGATPIPSPAPWEPPPPAEAPASPATPPNSPAPDTPPSASPNPASDGTSDTGLAPGTPTL